MPNNITVLSCVFPPEPVVSAQTSEQISHNLASQGKPVTVVASFPGRPGGKIYSGYRRALYAQKHQPAGYEIVRCFSVPSGDSSAASRLLENIVFGLTSAVLLAAIPRPGVIYSNTWPVFATGLMALVAGLRRIPYVVSVQDVYPESFASQGRGTNTALAYRVMRWIDRQVAIRARHIIVISETFAEIYANDRGIPRERISVVPNWVDAEDPDCTPNEAAALRESFSIPHGGFLAAYGGNIGIAAGVETFVEAFAHTGQNVYGLIAGEGSQLSACHKLAGDIAPNKINFLSPWPVKLTMPLYQAADLLILPTQGSQSMTSVPSKMIRYMLSGQPILATGLPGSDLANIIGKTQCGWLVPPDQPVALAEKILEVKRLAPEERKKRGEAGRRYALENFTSAACLPKVIDIIERAAK